MSANKKTVTINSRKLDGTIHRSWQCEMVEENKNYYVFVGEFQKEVSHSHLGVIRPKTVSFEYYWKNQWYNVFRFHEPDGDFRNFYCNINMPPRLKDGILDYIDLDIDVLVWKDFSYQMLDLEEFAENAKRYNYSTKLKQKVSETLSELVTLIENKNFPFNI